MTPYPTADRPAPALRYAYGTNGLADLRLDDALALLADLGYAGVGLTLDHMHLDPLAHHLAARTARVARALERYGLTVTVETGARYVLDPRRKHHPTLLDARPEARSARTGLLLTAVRVAADLGAHAVHCFSGPLPHGTAPQEGWARLAAGIGTVLDAADAAGVPLAVEPEPGHLLSDLDGFHRLRTALGDPAALGLTLDVGHCQCLEPLPPDACVRAAAPWLRHVQIEDMRRGVHEHLPFGAGEIDFPPVLAALRDAGYEGLVTVELPRDSHAGPDRAAESIRFLTRAETAAAAQAAGAVRAPDGARTAGPPCAQRPAQAAGPAPGVPGADPAREGARC
ncbi:sugar phosphate isomerase/epimerase family protein [Streptomyces albus]|uniref:sugar phosphate isomerase/epimerase family protein n=1 Tax=unclassified Streptomyces TaxID=2593676 RepID=UPI0005647A18|nr:MULTISPECIES: sugar phosphate isomerase/epimerase family protein [unclassified Streptomyces]KPC95267.1 xylose isomerase [Streptomyces sp. NRRL F-6602]